MEDIACFYSQLYYASSFTQDYKQLLQSYYQNGHKVTEKIEHYSISL